MGPMGHMGPIGHMGLFRPRHYTTEVCSRDSVAGLLWLTVILAVLAASAFSVDLSVRQFCAAGRVPGDLRRVLTWSELFAHGFGVVLLTATIAVLDPRCHRRLPRLLTCAFAPGIAANIVKLLVARLRPREFAADQVWDSFLGFFPSVWPVESYSRFDSRLQSFPSSHTAVAVGLAIGLASMYPRGRYLFFLFAVLAALQRVECSAHFLSDAVAGAAIGCLMGSVCVGRGPLSQVFDRFEGRTQSWVRPETPAMTP